MSNSPTHPEIRLGIDLGGTKIEIIALDRAGAERFRKRIPTPQGDYAGTVRSIAELVKVASQDVAHLCKRPSVGIGIPGTISPATGLIKGANSVCLIGHALDRDLEAAIGTPVRLGNDANCFALSEASDGAGVNAPIVFGAILGTGVGGGIVVDQKIISGPNAITGEWGHISLPWPSAAERPGRKCYCGRSGCVETFLSGPGLSADFEAHTGQTVTSQDIATHAEQNHADAVAAMDRYVHRLARALAAIINVLDPSVIVLGGGLSKMQRLYRDVPRLLPEFVFSDTVVTPIVPPKHGDSSGVRGAAWLWP